MKKSIARFVAEDEGKDLIDYALLAALVALASTAGMTLLKGGITGTFNKVISKL